VVRIRFAVRESSFFLVKLRFYVQPNLSLLLVTYLGGPWFLAFGVFGPVTGLLKAILWLRGADSCVPSSPFYRQSNCMGTCADRRFLFLLARTLCPFLEQGTKRWSHFEIKLIAISRNFFCPDWEDLVPPRLLSLSFYLNFLRFTLYVPMSELFFS